MRHIGQNLSRRKYRYQLCILISRLGIFSIPKHDQASAWFIPTSRSSYARFSAANRQSDESSLVKSRAKIIRPSCRPTDRPTDQPSSSLRRRSDTRRTHEKRERVERHAALSFSLSLTFSLSRRFSCSRYIGQPRRLSHGFFELFICMRSSACTYLYPL